MDELRRALCEHYVSEFKGAQSRFDAGAGAAQSYFVWCDHKFAPLLRDLPRDARILELGCGPGNMLEYLQCRLGFRDVTGIDISEEQVASACSRGLNAIVGDIAEHLRGHSDRYDVVIAFDLIEHFAKDELLAICGAIFDALQPGGRLLLQTPNGEGLFPGQVIHGDLTHLTIFSAASLQQLLTRVGFSDFRFFETGPVPKHLKGWVRLQLWRLIRALANAARAIESGKTQHLWTETLICLCRRPLATRARPCADNSAPAPTCHD